MTNDLRATVLEMEACGRAFGHCVSAEHDHRSLKRQPSHCMLFRCQDALLGPLGYNHKQRGRSFRGLRDREKANACWLALLNDQPQAQRPCSTCKAKNAYLMHLPATMLAMLAILFQKHAQTHQRSVRAR